MPSDLARAVLALGDGLISRDQFVLACTALAFDPPESFSTYLRSQGWVSADRLHSFEERLKADRRLNGDRSIATADYVSRCDRSADRVLHCIGQVRKSS